MNRSEITGESEPNINEIKVDDFKEDLVILFTIVCVILFLIFMLFFQITQEKLQDAASNVKQEEFVLNMNIMH